MTSPPTCSRSAATTRWSPRLAGPGSWSPGPRTSARRCAGRSTPASPTWSTSPRTQKTSTRDPPQASNRRPGLVRTAAVSPDRYSVSDGYRHSQVPSGSSLPAHITGSVITKRAKYGHQMTETREKSRDDQGFACARARKRAPSTTTRSIVPAPTTTSASAPPASEPAASEPAASEPAASEPAGLAPSALAPSALAPSALAPSGLAPSALAPSASAPSVSAASALARSAWEWAGRAMNPNTSRLPSTSVSSASTTTSAPSGLALRCSRLTAVPTVVSPSVRFGATAATVAASASASSRGVASTGRFPLPIASAVSASVTAARTVARSPAARPGTSPGTPALFDDGNQVAFLNHIALGHGELGELARALGKDRDLHFHGLQDDQRVAVSSLIAFGRHDLPHVRDHLRADLGHHMPPRVSSPAIAAVGSATIILAPLPVTPSAGQPRTCRSNRW